MVFHAIQFTVKTFGIFLAILDNCWGKFLIAAWVVAMDLFCFCLPGLGIAYVVGCVSLLMFAAIQFAAETAAVLLAILNDCLAEFFMTA